MKPRILQLLLAITLAAAPCVAETGYVTVLVQDAQQHPVRLVEIEIENNGGSKLTKDDGMAQLPLAKSLNPTDWITFRLVHSPPGKDLEIVSPWDYRTQALAIDEKALGPDHSDVADELNNLAMLLWAKDDLAVAELLSRHALAIDEKALGPNHPSVATDLDNLAMLSWDKGDQAAAEPFLRRALAIDEKALGPKNSSTRKVRKDLTDLQHNAATAHQ